MQQGVLKANQIDSRLQQYSKKLKDELDQLKETLKKSGSLSFEDNTTIGNLKRDLIKVFKFHVHSSSFYIYDNLFNNNII